MPRHSLLGSGEGGPSQVAEGCSGGRAERVLGSSEGGPSKVTDGCSGGHGERVRGSSEGDPSKVAEGCSGGHAYRFNKIAIQGTRQMAVDWEARAYRESTHIVILSVCAPCPYTKCNLP